MRDFRQLLVWEKAHQLTLEIYRLTEFFPTSELYGLRSQIRRSAMSIGSNIAEGAGRLTDSDFARFLDIASGSSNEAEYQLILARDLGYLPAEDYQKLEFAVNEVKKMLASLARKIRLTSS
jgi:four helix bundle protein